MAEWKKSEDGDYYIWLGPVCFVLVKYGDGWRVVIPKNSNSNFIFDITPMPLEQSQAAALSWARGVLGAALVDAGAEVNTCFACSVCKAEGAAIGLPCWVNNCDGVIRKFKTVTVQIVE